MDKPMRVCDLPPEAILIQDSQERQAVLESLGLEELLDQYPTLFVLVGDAEYRKVWGVHGFVPYLDEPVEVLYAAGA